MSAKHLAFQQQDVGDGRILWLNFSFMNSDIFLWRRTTQPRDVPYHENKMDNESNCDTAVKPYWLYKHDII